jgi:hypothetical protein
MTSEVAVKANSSEARRLYQRGVAAARGGQKRVAAGFLTRAVQLDPSNEPAWLWLSGVLDDPRQMAFCLHAVLKLNPQNERAQHGLRVLEKKYTLNGGVAAAPGLSMPAAESDERPEARTEQESWWIQWRHSRKQIGRVRLILWGLPIILVGVALLLYESFALAVNRDPGLPAPPVEAAAFSVQAPVAEPGFEPILEAEPLAVVESLTVSYLDALEPLRAELRTATEAYRQATSQPGGASVSFTTATQQLRTVVSRALGELEQLRPPGTLQPAHSDYQKGLELELEALDALLEFYSTYDVSNANRAALRFQEADALH